MIPDQIIHELRARVDVLEVIGARVDLKKAGRHYKGRCPFHDERTPSFYVNPGKKVFRCHGCGEAGDAIEFVMKLQGLKFADAVRQLAERYGIALSNGDGKAYDPVAMAAAWAEQDRKRREAEAAAEARLHARAAARYQKVWNNAKAANPHHAYLKRKKIPPGDLRQIGSRLLVPMKGIGDGEGIMSLQTIDHRGVKLFARGGRSQRVRDTIGKQAFKADGTIYVAEGYATAASIHEVSKAPVLVAFTARNLRDIAAYLRKRYPAARIVIAADNDRWSANEKGPNPGVTAARAAAAALERVEVAIPDFQKLPDKGKGPTDFNDLYCLEGELAVKRWLDPARAKEARTIDAAAAAKAEAKAAPARVERVAPPPPKPPADDGPPAPPPPKDMPTWLHGGEFRVLGHKYNEYVYLPRGKGASVWLTASQHKKEYLQQLAPLSYWATHWPANKKGADVDWDAARDDLYGEAYRIGVFDDSRRRGRGVWREGKGHVLHLGNRLIVPDEPLAIAPEAFKSADDFIYERLAKLHGPELNKPMGRDEASAILDVFDGPRWREPASGMLLAGWTALAPLCGALPWRPHVWVTGNRGSGKTYIVEHLVRPLTGDMSVYVLGASTEAGIRQDLEVDSLPVMWDEAEEDETAGKRIQAVLGLARAASSESQARVVKGTTNGKSMYFRCRSMFCLASINGALHQESDKSRVTLLSLVGKAREMQTTTEQDEARAHWLGLKPRIDALTVEHGRRLVARTLGLLQSGMLLRSVEVFRSAAAEVLQDQRTADQYGTLYAGAWTLRADEPPDPAEARELIASEDLHPYQSDQTPEGMKALAALLQQVERLETTNGPRTLSVGQLVDVCTGNGAWCSTQEADAKLRQCGLRVDVLGQALFIANDNDWMRRAFRDTIYQRGIGGFLRSLPGVEPSGEVRYAGWKKRGTRVPLSLLEGVGGPA